MGKTTRLQGKVPVRYQVGIPYLPYLTKVIIFVGEVYTEPCIGDRSIIVPSVSEAPNSIGLYIFG